MSAALSERDQGIVSDIAATLEHRLRLSEHGVTYVKRWATYRLRGPSMPATSSKPAVWPARPRCTFNLTQGQYVRQQVDAELERALRDEGRTLAPLPRPGR